MEIKRTSQCCHVNPQCVHFLNVLCNPHLRKAVVKLGRKQNRAGEMMKGMKWHLWEKQVNRPWISHPEERWELSVISSKKYPATIRWQAQNKQKIKTISTERVNCLWNSPPIVFSVGKITCWKGVWADSRREKDELISIQVKWVNRQQAHSQL